MPLNFHCVHFPENRSIRSLDLTTVIPNQGDIQSDVIDVYFVWTNWHRQK
jgi:hypothetical protein